MLDFRKKHKEKKSGGKLVEKMKEYKPDYKLKESYKQRSQN